MNKLGIRTSVKNLLARNDATDSIVDGFIEMAMARIQRTLRVPPMEKMEIITVVEDSPNTIVLPADFLRMKHLYTTSLSINNSIEYKDVSSFMQIPDAPGGVPRIYTRVQGSLLLKNTPPVGLKIAMVYYGEIPDLVADTDTNFLTEIAPDLLIYTALSFASDYYIDDRKEQFEQVAESAFQQLMDQSYETEMAQEGLAVSPSFNSPEY